MSTPRLPTVPPRASATAIPVAAYNAVLRGIVRDSKSKKPVAGATVRIGTSNHVATTNAAGEYVLRFPPSVPQPVEVTAPSYAEDLAMGAVQPHSTTVLNFSLTKLTPGVPVAPPPPVSFGKP